MRLPGTIISGADTYSLMVPTLINCDAVIGLKCVKTSQLKAICFGSW